MRSFTALRAAQFGAKVHFPAAKSYEQLKGQEVRIAEFGRDHRSKGTNCARLFRRRTGNCDDCGDFLMCYDIPIFPLDSCYKSAHDIGSKSCLSEEQFPTDRNAAPPEALAPGYWD